MHPQRVKSQQGRLEHRFSKADIETFKAQEALNADETGQDKPDGTPDNRVETGESRAETADYKPPVKQEKTGFWKRVFKSDLR